MKRLSTLLMLLATVFLSAGCVVEAAAVTPPLILSGSSVPTTVPTPVPTPDPWTALIDEAIRNAPTPEPGEPQWPTPAPGDKPGIRAVDWEQLAWNLMKLEERVEWLEARPGAGATEHIHPELHGHGGTGFGSDGGYSGGDAWDHTHSDPYGSLLDRVPAHSHDDYGGVTSQWP